jgi:hypothetical protein
MRERRYGAIISDMARQHQDSEEGFVLLRQIRAEGIRTPHFIRAGSASRLHLDQVLQAGGDGCTNDATTLLRLVTLACSAKTIKTRIGLLSDADRGPDADLRQELDAASGEVELIRDPFVQTPLTDAVQAWGEPSVSSCRARTQAGRRRLPHRRLEPRLARPSPDA